MIRVLLVTLAEVAALAAAVGLVAWVDRDRPLTPSDRLGAVL
jgi:hypothetical protein